MATSDWSAKLWWSVPATAVVTLLLTVVLTGGVKEEKYSKGSSYDASMGGFRAAYLLLEELKYPVTRSKRPTGDAVRWVLFPTSNQDAGALDEWVRQGGIVILAVGNTDFSKEMGLALDVTELKTGADTELAAPDLGQVAAGPLRVDWVGAPGRVWLEAGGRPLVSIQSRGRGQVWLLHRPEIVTNKYIGKADNAVLVCRLAEATLEGRDGKAAFDEYVHGLRERPGVVELLLEPPALWVTLQSLLLLGLILWYAMPRFGFLHPPPVFRRRSKEEFLDAMATLLERKGDCADAFRAARDGLVRDMEQELGLPAWCRPEDLVREACRRRPVQADRLERLLRTGAVPAGASKSVFLHALNDLETLRHDFFHGRADR
jgi:hypothetical protein